MKNIRKNNEEILIDKNNKDKSRIQRLRKRYQTEIPVISIERAKYYSEKWFETENSGLSLNVRVALSMKHVYENMTYYIDPDDRIAGYWTEYFLGVPIDIEKGIFNKVFQTELKISRLFWFRLKALLKSFIFLIKRREFSTFRKNNKILRSMGTQPLNFSMKTMNKRKINNFTINKKDRKILLKKLFPKWKGKTIVNILEKKIPKSGFISGDMLNFSRAFPANTSRQTMLISMCSTIALIQGHLILDYEKVLKKGLLKIKEEVEEIIARNKTLSVIELEFLKSVKIALEGVIIFANKLASKVEETYKSEKDSLKKRNLKKMVENCKTVPLYPAENFYQAIQSVWTLKTAVEIAHPINLHCLGRMDQIFYPYYKKDIENGFITRDNVLELLEELLLKLMSQNIRPETNILSNFYHRYLGSTPVTIGGLKSDGSDGTNDLTYLFIEAAGNSRAVTNVSLRVNKKTPNDLLLAVTDTLYKGSSNLSIFNDEINIEAMKRRGFEEKDARNYAIMGCVEMTCPGKTGAMSANALLLCRLLDITMRNGNSQTLMGIIKDVGLKTGNPDSFTTFNQFLNAFFTQAEKQINMIVNVSNLRDQIYAENLPAPYISAFMEGCIGNKKDVTQGGAKYDLSGISFINSIANLTDSLYVIKKLIFDEKITNFKELLEAIDNNYVNFKDLYLKIIKLKGKWGNGFREVDDLANKITTRLFKETYKYSNYRGGPFVPYIISMTTHTIDGRISIATPDGRKAATPYAASCNPYNVEKNGVTSVLNSVAALDFEHVLGCAVNMKFHPTAIGRNIENRKKWIALIRTYFELGGAQLQPTVVSSEMLHDAQINPENYRDLIVKVGGYSAYFTELGIEIQNEIISRTEH
ncbi:MAG: pyruvate formate lyase family protein [Promethearchaeota archaeon]